MVRALFACKLQSFLANITSWMQKVVIVFLILIMVTNLRFMRNSDGYILTRLLTLFAQPKLCRLVLSSIYVIKSCFLVLDTFKITKTVDQQLNDLSQTEESQKSQSSTILQANNSIAIANKSFLSNKTKAKIKNINFFTLQGLKNLVIITKYILRSYTLYVLVFNENIDSMMSHLSQSDVTTFVQIVCMTVHFGFVFISFMVEIYLEDEYFSFLKEFKPITNTDLSEKFEFQNGDLKMNQSDKRYQRQKVQKDNKITFKSKNYQAVISLFQIVVFIVLRLKAITNVYQFFNPTSKEIKFQFDQFFKSIIFIICPVFFGYLIVMLFIRNIMKQTRSKANPLQLNGSNQLVQQMGHSNEINEQELNY